MTQKTRFYHAGCAVYVDAERRFVDALVPARFDIEIVHLGETPERIGEAKAAGVQSVPAFVMDGQPYHINFGAALADLKGGA